MDSEQIKVIKVSAPGKIILSGEHSVVYGYPALLTALDRRLSVEISSGSGFSINSRETSAEHAEYSARKAAELIGVDLGRVNIQIDSNIPIGAGMGSSAALAVAITGGLLAFEKKAWDIKRINSIAYEIEKKQHGRPSGGDNTVVTHGGFLEFKKKAEGVFEFNLFLPQKDLPPVFIINMGTPTETTGEMVSMVGELYQNKRNKIDTIFKRMGQITRSFLQFLGGEGNIDVYELIKENQRLLEELGIVSSAARQIVRRIERMGASAKISGAGGIKSGSGILLCFHEDPGKLMEFCKENNLEYFFPVKLGAEGVKIEKNN